MQTASADLPIGLISVLVPAYNECSRIAPNLEELARFLSGPQCADAYEVIVIDDGSTDGTYDAARDVSASHPNVRVVRHDENRGLGCAIRTGFACAKGSIAVVFDSDLSYSPQVIPALVEQLRRNQDDLVLASPYMRGGKVADVPFVRRFLSREANRFLSFATNGRFATITCMVRAYRLDVFRNIDSVEERMEVNPELFFKALKCGARVSEVPATLQWSSERAVSHRAIHLRRTARQIARTMRYGIAYRPAILLALPGILPGVLPLVVAVMVFMHLSLATIAGITAVTMVIQNTSLALFAGQLAIFGRNAVRNGNQANAKQSGVSRPTPDVPQ